MGRFRHRDNHGKRVRVGTLIDAVLAHHVPDRRLQLAKIERVWRKAAPAPLHLHTWPVALDGGRLVVHVRDHQWLHELTYLRGDLLERVREHCAPQPVTELILRVGTLPPG